MLAGEIITLPKIRDIIGTTEINHAIRKKLNITSDEYCVIDLIEKCIAKKVLFSYQEVYRRIGITEEELKPLISSIGKKGLLNHSKEKGFGVTELWKGEFEVTQEEFGIFWEPIEFPGNPKRIIRWTGSKTDGFKKYCKARKEYDSVYLLNQKNNYFKLLYEKPDRPILGCSVFLNMQTKRFEEEWHLQLKRSSQTEQGHGDKTKSVEELFDD